MGDAGGFQLALFSHSCHPVGVFVISSEVFGNPGQLPLVIVLSLIFRRRRIVSFIAFTCQDLLFLVLPVVDLNTI